MRGTVSLSGLVEASSALVSTGCHRWSCISDKMWHALEISRSLALRCLPHCLEPSGQRHDVLRISRLTRRRLGEPPARDAKSHLRLVYCTGNERQDTGAAARACERECLALCRPFRPVFSRRFKWITRGTTGEKSSGRGTGPRPRRTDPSRAERKPPPPAVRPPALASPVSTTAYDLRRVRECTIMREAKFLPEERPKRTQSGPRRSLSVLFEV